MHPILLEVIDQCDFVILTPLGYEIHHIESESKLSVLLNEHSEKPKIVKMSKWDYSLLILELNPINNTEFIDWLKLMSS